MTKLITVDFNNDSLHLVAKQLTKATGKNIVYAPKLKDKRVSLYVQYQPLQNILMQLAFANEMTIDVENDSLFHLRVFDKSQGSKPKKANKKNKNSTLNYSIAEDSSITLVAKNHTLGEIVEVLFGELQLDYYYYSTLDSKISLKVYNEPLDILLQKLFYGTNYTFRKKENIYYFGDRNLEGLRETRRIHLISRSVEKIITYIPTNLIKDVQLLEFPELNSLMVSGSYPQILELEAYIKSIDKPVPVVQIEVIIIDYNRNHNVASGFEMGLGEQPVQTTGSMGSGGIDLTVGAQSINSMINSFNGFGALNLGPVTRNFYVTLKAMETNGIIKTRSTPKLATLNGTEANITIAQTEYYVQENQSFQGVQNPIPVTTRTYNPVTANFELNIKPYLAGEDQVTLTIQVSQSDFTARIAPDAPPGQVTRTFNTIIRVKDQEMILLGGLEETTKEETGSGVPVLSRIPVIKWFFSSRNKRKSDNRLNIFIKPTIIR